MNPSFFYGKCSKDKDENSDSESDHSDHSEISRTELELRTRKR